MDYDILNYLIPTVQKRWKNQGNSHLENQQENLVDRRLANHMTQISQSLKTTSSSLVLKNVTNKVLLKHFSILNLTSKQTVKTKKVSVSNNPVIKITVVPIVPTTQPSKLVYKRKQIRKNIQKTLSITDSCKHNKELYLPAYRQAYHDIHDIRETSSVDSYEHRKYRKYTKHDELSLDRMQCTKKLLNSLNMENKGSRDKKGKDNNEKRGISRKGRKGNNLDPQGCICEGAKVDNVLADMNSRKNRVTIYGRLGIGENNKYVLNCAATVDNKPIDTNIKHENVCPVSNAADNEAGERNQTKATQANMNMDFLYDTKQSSKKVQCQCKNSIDVATTISQSNTFTTKERKSPLIVISVYQANDILQEAKSLDGLIQINQMPKSPHTPRLTRTNSKKITRNTGNKSITRANRNRSKSPLVKTNATMEEENIFLESRPTFPHVKTDAKMKNTSLKSRSPTPQIKKVTRDVNVSMKSRPLSPQLRQGVKIEKLSFKSRSTSPLVKTITRVENTERNTKLRSRSPSPQVRTITKTDKNRSTSQFASVKNIDKNKHEDRKYINRKNPKPLTGPDSQAHKTWICKDSHSDKSRRISDKVNAANNVQIKNCGGKEVPDVKNIKKSLVKNFTQKMFLSNRGHGKLKSDTSKVTIDIDGDNEQYKVLFQQDKLSTDLCVRKTLKTQNTKVSSNLKSNEKGYDSEDSMDKILTLSNETIPGKQRIIHQQTSDKQLNNSGALDKRTSGLKIRDSLEICHWREEGYCQHKNISSKDDKTSNNRNTNKNFVKKQASNENILAPVKHYRGDQCCVPNPFDRDQEIRDLLGIKKPRSGKYEFVQEVLPEFVGKNQLHRFLPETCAKNLLSFSAYHQSNFHMSDNKIHDNDNFKIFKKPTLVTASVQCEHSELSFKETIHNPNFQVFLQVEQFPKQKKIMLSRKQYDKVMKTVQKNLSNKLCHEKRRLNNSKKSSVISIGEIRKAKKQRSSTVKISRTVQVKQTCENMHTTKENIRNDEQKDENKPLFILYPTEKKANDVNSKGSQRKTISSMEVRYASMAHMKHVTFSSCDLKDKPPEALNSLEKKKCPSLQTIFTGYKRSTTPNLGASAYDLYSDLESNRSDNKYTLNPREGKLKKRFLRRLISCLAMRSAKVSKDTISTQYEPRSMMSSFDSYHINTSLGGRDITSSLYDTSASFYSNHTILPIARMRRGFFSSVRGFITNLKSR